MSTLPLADYNAPQDTTVNIITLTACVLPLLSFPFLPARVPVWPFASTPPSSHQSILGPFYCLFYASISGIILFWILRVALISLVSFSSADPSSANVVYPSKLVIYLAYITAAVAFPPLIKWNIWNVWSTRIGYREPMPEDFAVPASLAIAPACVEFSHRYIVPYYPWWRDYSLDVLTAAYLPIILCMPPRMLGLRFLYKIGSRDVSWWYWLKKPGVKEKDDDDVDEADPWWSWIVYRVVMFGVPSLWLVALIRVLMLALR